MRSFKYKLVVRICFVSFLILGITSSAVERSMEGEHKNAQDKKTEASKNKEVKKKKNRALGSKNHKDTKKKSPALIKTYSTVRNTGQFLDKLSQESESEQKEIPAVVSVKEDSVSIIVNESFLAIEEDTTMHCNASCNCRCKSCKRKLPIKKTPTYGLGTSDTSSSKGSHSAELGDNAVVVIPQIDTVKVVPVNASNDQGFTNEEENDQWFQEEDADDKITESKGTLTRKDTRNYSSKTSSHGKKHRKDKKPTQKAINSRGNKKEESRSLLGWVFDKFIKPFTKEKNAKKEKSETEKKLHHKAKVSLAGLSYYAATPSEKNIVNSGLSSEDVAIQVNEKLGESTLITPLHNEAKIVLPVNAANDQGFTNEEENDQWFQEEDADDENHEQQISTLKKKEKARHNKKDKKNKKSKEKAVSSKNKKEGSKSFLDSLFSNFKKSSKKTKKQDKDDLPVKEQEYEKSDISLAGFYYCATDPSFEHRLVNDGSGLNNEEKAELFDKSMQEKRKEFLFFEDDELDVDTEERASRKEEAICSYCKKHFIVSRSQRERVEDSYCPCCGYKALQLQKCEEKKENPNHKSPSASLSEELIDFTTNNPFLLVAARRPVIGKERGHKMFSEYRMPDTGLMLSQITEIADLPIAQSIKEEDARSHHWKRFDFKESGFSISLPLKPEHSKQTIEMSNPETKIFYETYISEPNADTVYVVSVWEYPKTIDIKDPEANLQEGFSGMLSALPESRVLLMKSKEVQGFHALEFHVKNSGVIFQGELISVHNILYQIFTVYKDEGKKSSLSEKDYQYFIKSFTLTRMEKKSSLSLHSGKVRL